MIRIILMHDRTYQKRLDEIKMLQELNHTFSDRIDELCIQKKDFQQRIDKAIELLERYDDRENNYYVPVMETIDILKGSDTNA